MTRPAVLHIDTGRGIRGGQRQLLLLSSRLRDMGLRQTIAVPRGSDLRARVGDIPVVEVSPAAMVRVIRLSRLKEAVATRGIQIIHANDSHAHTLGIMLKRWNPDLKLVVTRRVIFPPSGSASRRLKYRRGVDRFIAISGAVRSSLIDAGVDDGLIEVIFSGLEIDVIRSAVADTRFVSSVLPESSRVIVTAGALTREKDMGTAIKAYSLAAEEIGDSGLLILGEGPERERLERLREKLGRDRVVFAGHREPLAPIFKACFLFLLTSASEGLNTSAIEAAACGLPLVVSDVGGLREIAEHQYNGLLCPPGDPERFAEAIVEISTDESLRAVMANRSMERAARFDIDGTVKKTIDVYERVLAG